MRLTAGLFLALLGGVASCGGASATGAMCDPSHLTSGTCSEGLAMRLPDSLPPARGDAFGDRDDAAQLGFALFFDGDLGGGTGCMTCHAPEDAFADSRSVSIGQGTGTRNSPTVFDAARLTVFFWDGRADSLWSQPIFPIENPVEMGSSRLALAHFIDNDASLKSGYEAIFGTLPDMSTWPSAGMPGVAAFDSLPAATQDQVNRIAANVGKCLEAYMRKNTSGPAPFDAYLDGDASQLTDVAIRGLEAFIDDGCVTCHSGPMLTDQKFHNLNFPSLPGASPDPGRPAGIPILEHNVFNLAGPYADPGTGGGPVVVESDPQYGSFRTPPLRNVARTAPYGHNGVFLTLDDVLAFHASRVSATDRGAIVAFLQTLNGGVPPLPWSNWPSPQ